jgi:uncharacterized protein (DUF488 family)
MKKLGLGGHEKIRIFTIGFTGKTARQFFAKLKDAGVEIVIDVRLNNKSQLAGFAKKQDLEYFLSEIAQIRYIYKPNLAPTKDILDGYRKKEIDWVEYERRFKNLLVERDIKNDITPTEFDNACILCSEENPDKCHRRLLAEYLRDIWGNVVITHL